MIDNPAPMIGSRIGRTEPVAHRSSSTIDSLIATASSPTLLVGGNARGDAAVLDVVLDLVVAA